MEHYALIVAGGKGTRMHAEVPKQFLMMKDRPVLMYTLERFIEADPLVNIVLVLPEEHAAYWKLLCAKHHFQIPHQVVEGGETRTRSVCNGLRVIPDNSLVAIHDGVRPFPPIKTILDAYRVAEEKGNAIACVPLKDSIREVIGSANRAVDRDLFRLVQTPQTFRSDLIKSCYEQLSGELSLPLYSDDATLAERFGHPAHFVDGAHTNIKITTPEDLVTAEAFLEAGY